MNSIRRLEQRRNAILEEMRSLRSMARGSITEQYLKVVHKGRDEPVSRGPYYVFSRREGGRTVSWRLRSPQELQRARKDVESHKRFVALCKQFEQLTERLGQLERQEAELTAEKKRRRSRSSKTER